jgi:hypothetical protein
MNGVNPGDINTTTGVTDTTTHINIRFNKDGDIIAPGDFVTTAGDFVTTSGDFVTTSGDFVTTTGNFDGNVFITNNYGDDEPDGETSGAGTNGAIYFRTVS